MEARVLLVDDEAAITSELGPLLLHSGFDVAVARNGEEALHKVGAFKPNLIVLDVLMPRIDGREVCRRLRAAGDWTPVIMLTQVGTPAERIMSLEEGKSGFFQESNPGPHRYFTDTWVREGDRYLLQESRTEPSAYATLVEFVYRLSRGEDKLAAELVADSTLVARARALGLAVKPAARGWLIQLDSPEVEQRGPIRFVEGPAVTVYFEEQAGAWSIKNIVEMPG